MELHVSHFLPPTTIHPSRFLFETKRIVKVHGRSQFSYYSKQQTSREASSFNSRTSLPPSPRSTEKSDDLLENRIMSMTVTVVPKVQSISTSVIIRPLVSNSLLKPTVRFPLLTYVSSETCESLEKGERLGKFFTIVHRELMDSGFSDRVVHLFIDFSSCFPPFVFRTKVLLGV